MSRELVTGRLGGLGPLRGAVDVVASEMIFLNR